MDALRQSERILAQVCQLRSGVEMDIGQSSSPPSESLFVDLFYRNLLPAQPEIGKALSEVNSRSPS
jgi:hypothetical protein